MAEVLSYVVAALADEGGGAAALSALCDTLFFGGDDVFTAYLSRRLPALVAAAAGAAGAVEEKGDVPLLAARAIAEACEFDPVWSGSFAQHGAVEALRGRLLAVDNVELAEEVLLDRAAPTPFA